jgi:hypothetical protein
VNLDGPGSPAGPVNLDGLDKKVLAVNPVGLDGRDSQVFQGGPGSRAGLVNLVGLGNQA